jgi:signal transduction histidine kinase
LITIVNDLLDVERLRTQRIRLEKRRIDIRTVIAEALDQTRPMIARKGHECACRLPDAPVIVCGDRIRLVQILSNLLINAAKYTPAGGRISVSVMALPTVAQIVVQDNGAGMSQELLATLFEPYVQAKVSSDRKEGGLGLGLALAKQLTALHEGELSAHSDGPGKGSRFTLCLPLAYQAASFEAGEKASPAFPGVGNGAVLPPACAVTTSGRTGRAG